MPEWFSDGGLLADSVNLAYKESLSLHKTPTFFENVNISNPQL